MLEPEFHISKLLAGYFRDQLGPDQKDELNLWKNASLDNLRYFNLLNEEHNQKAELKKFQMAKSKEQEIWNKTLAKTGLSFQLPESEIHAGRTLKIPLLSRWIAAASILLVLGTGIYFYAAQSGGKKQNQYQQDIAPGTFGATLTLANGKKIRLAEAKDGELVKEAGIVITKSPDGRLIYEIISPNATGPASASNKMNTLSTAKGETYQVKLPDGSLVVLNAASSLTYPASFTGLKTRTVKLDGEGYFEVAKHKAQPFVVLSQDQKVEVLGTHFNIRSYLDDEAQKTTLIEGSVKMSAGGIVKILKPGEQASLQNKKIEVTRIDAKLATAWKDNEFMFEGESIESIMKMVERWYNVQVVYEGEKPKDKFVGGVSRFDKVSKVLGILESTGRVRFKIEGRIIYVQQ